MLLNDADSNYSNPNYF